LNYRVFTDLQVRSSALILIQNWKGNFSWSVCFRMLQIFRFVAVKFVEYAAISVSYGPSDP